MAYNYSNDYSSYNTKKWADMLAGQQSANQQTSNQTSNQTSSNQTSNQNCNQAFTDFSGLDEAIDFTNGVANNRQSQQTTPPDQV
jgi:hypothetical protein